MRSDNAIYLSFRRLKQQEGFGVRAVFQIKLLVYWDNSILELFITQDELCSLLALLGSAFWFSFFIAFFSPDHSKSEIPLSNAEHAIIYFSVLKISDSGCNIV